MYVERQELRGLGTCCPARAEEMTWVLGGRPLTPSRCLPLRVNTRRGVQGDHGLVKEREDGEGRTYVGNERNLLASPERSKREKEV